MPKLLTYKELVELSKIGKLLEWKDVSGEQIAKLYADENKGKSEIADLFNVSDRKVTSKRSSYGIKMEDNKKMLYMNGALMKLNEMLEQRRISKISFYKILYIVISDELSRDNFDEYVQNDQEQYKNYYIIYKELVIEVKNFASKYLNETKYSNY